MPARDPAIRRAKAADLPALNALIQASATYHGAYQAMVATYAPPRHAAAMARASSVDRFCEAFPAHHALVGPPLVSAEPPLPGGEPPPHPR